MCAQTPKEDWETLESLMSNIEKTIYFLDPSTVALKLPIFHTKAAAWAKPSQSQAVVDGFGLA